MRSSLTTSTTIFPSFFDFYGDPSSFKFVKPEPKHKPHLDKQPITKAQITCKCFDQQFSLKGHFKLQGTLLAYYHDEASDTPRLVLDLLYAKLRVIDKSLTLPKFKLLITRKGSSFELCFSKQTTAEYWIQSLQAICVLSNLYDKYTPLHFVDEKSPSTVYLAKDKTRPDGLFAVKRFTKNQLNTPDLKSNVLNQILRMRAFEHPNIVKLNQVYETESSIYLVKEYNPAQTLQYIFSTPGFNFSDFEPETVRILNHIFQALAYISSQGVIHRHVYPNNIVITNEGDAKVFDFGLVSRNDIPQNSGDHPLPPGYIAPEVFKYDKTALGTTYNALCDVFSAGCIFYEMLFGVPLFYGEDEDHILELNKSYSYSEVSRRIIREIKNPESTINKQGLDLLLQLLESDPKKRISAETVLKHPYFKPETNKFVQFNSSNEIFLLSISKIRSSTLSEASSPLMQFKSSHRLSDSDRQNTTSNFLDPKDLSAHFKGKNTQTSPSKNLLNKISESPRSLETGGSEENLSYCKLQDVKGRFRNAKKGCEEEDSGELDEMEEEKVEIQAFLEAHIIDVAMKNPGRMF